MHRRTFAWLAATTAALALAPLAAAQEEGKAETAATGTELRFAGVRELTIAERNAAELKLDAETKVAVEALAEEARAAAAQNADAFREEVGKMNELLAADAPDTEAIDRQSEALAGVWAAGLKARLDTSVRLRGLLTPEQRKKLGELRGRTQRRQRAQGPLNPPIGPAPAIAPPAVR